MNSDQVIERLRRSPNPCDQRKGHDLGLLAELSRTEWRRRFAILRFTSAPDRSLVAVCAMRTPGLIWAGDGPVPHEEWAYALGLPNNFPLAHPWVQFGDPTPYCPHVVHEALLPDLRDLPPDLQAYLRQGTGYCCAVRSDQWSDNVATHNLALFVRHLSCLLSFAVGRGEPRSLNPVAMEHRQRLAAQGKLPLGRPLPFPAAFLGGEAQAGGGPAGDAGDESEDVDWHDD